MNDKPYVDPSTPVEIAAGRLEPDEILIVRRGPGANCSSIGSALDLLFVSATLASVVMAAIAAAFSDENAAEQDKPQPTDDKQET